MTGKRLLNPLETGHRMTAHTRRRQHIQVLPMIHPAMKVVLPEGDWFMDSAVFQ
jgi:hypothetical protein